jgi:peptide-methionine (S)-S-oxide reductase
MNKLATFGAGCFWGVEAVFRAEVGVIEAVSGYAGGHVENPTYEDVCTDSTGHAEVVQVTFDPARVSYSRLLEVFFGCHNPTQVNRQGADVGSQYRSVVFYHSPEQKEQAEQAKAMLLASGKYKAGIATSIEPAPRFHKAEEYHQRYLEKRGKTSCHI